jgi:hypothetical protein
MCTLGRQDVGEAVGERGHAVEAIRRIHREPAQQHGLELAGDPNAPDRPDDALNCS